MIRASYFVDARDVNRKIDRIERAISNENLAVVMRGSIVQFFQERMESRFADGGDDAVGVWEPLDADTIAIKDEEGGERGINVRTGALRDWLTSAPGDLDVLADSLLLEWPGEPPERDEIADKLNHLQFGSDDPYAPPRPTIGANETDLAGVVRILAHSISIEAGFALMGGGGE